MRLFACLTVLFAGMASAESPPPDTAALVTQNSYTLSYGDAALSGPGADFLGKATAKAQFVLFGEEHMDHAVPLFAGALYKMLHEAHGFRYLVVEQDPVAIEDALKSERRGNPERLAAWAKRYPSLYEFDSDEDLSLLAMVGALEDRDDAIWGVEQATGALRYLEELQTLAPDAAARERTQKLLDDAKALDHEATYTVNWLVAAATPAHIESLVEVFHAKTGSRAARLLAGLAKSSEIFNYYRRAEAGEYVGLFNNTVREEVLKANFLERYRVAAKRGKLPKAMFKFGGNHLYHGKNPTQAFPIGNLAHEFAIVNGMEAYGLYVQPLGENYPAYQELPEWMRPLLPASEPTVATVIDLRALRPYQRVFREKIAAAEQWQLRELINGYDAIVLLPGSRMATRTLGGRTIPYGK